MSTCMMFVCDRCNNVDNIRLSYPSSDGYLCYRCLNGRWHNVFPEETYDPHSHWVINRNNPHFKDNGEPSFS